jgi:hypothetical protein
MQPELEQNCAERHDGSRPASLGCQLGAALAIVAAPLAAFALLNLALAVGERGPLAFVIILAFQTLPGILLFLAGWGHRRLAWRLAQTLVIGVIAGGAVSAALGLGVFVLVGRAFLPVGPGSDFAGLGLLIIAMLIGSAVYTVFLITAFWRFIWRRRGEFQRERLSLLWILAACGVEVGSWRATYYLRDLFCLVFGCDSW